MPCGVPAAAVECPAWQLLTVFLPISTVAFPVVDGPSHWWSRHMQQLLVLVSWSCNSSTDTSLCVPPAQRSSSSIAAMLCHSVFRVC